MLPSKDLLVPLLTLAVLLTKAKSVLTWSSSLWDVKAGATTPTTIIEDTLILQLPQDGQQEQQQYLQYIEIHSPSAQLNRPYDFNKNNNNYPAKKDFLKSPQLYKPPTYSGSQQYLYYNSNNIRHQSSGAQDHRLQTQYPVLQPPLIPGYNNNNNNNNYFYNYPTTEAYKPSKAVANLLQETRRRQDYYPCPSDGRWVWNGQLCIIISKQVACHPRDLVVLSRNGKAYCRKNVEL